METETALAATAFAIGVAVTPIYLVLLIKLVRTLTSIRDVLVTPLGDPRGGAHE